MDFAYLTCTLYFTVIDMHPQCGTETSELPISLRKLEEKYLTGSFSFSSTLSFMPS